MCWVHLLLDRQQLTIGSQRLLYATNQLAVAEPTLFPDRSPIYLMIENRVLLGLSIAIMTVSAKQWASLDMYHGR